MILDELYTLSNGVDIPKLGLGTWFISNKAVVQAVKDAVEIGYRHIDTAQAYQNESGVGEGLRACGVDREALFLTTKLAAEVKSYPEAVASIDVDLQRYVGQKFKRHFAIALCCIQMVKDTLIPSASAAYYTRFRCIQMLPV
jgi:diketogulonate reductase-like aldo/keto reductase